MKKNFYILSMLLAVILSACSSDEPMPEVSVVKTVSEAEFERMVVGKIWVIAVDRTPEGVVGEVRYFAICEDETVVFDYLQLGGDDRNMLGLIFENGRCKMLKYRTRSQSDDIPYYYIEECEYEFDETTGLISVSAQIDYYDECHLLYVERVADNELVLHEDFGLLKTFSKSWFDEQGRYCFEKKESIESYARGVYKSVQFEDIAHSWGNALTAE